MDMVNFTIQSLRPHLQRNLVDYERAKFQEILEETPSMFFVDTGGSSQWPGNAGSCLGTYNLEEAKQGISISVPLSQGLIRPGVPSIVLVGTIVLTPFLVPMKCF